jgi:hypothetical protein
VQQRRPKIRCSLRAAPYGQAFAASSAGLTASAGAGTDAPLKTTLLTPVPEQAPSVPHARRPLSDGYTRNAEVFVITDQSFIRRHTRWN